MKKYSQKYIIKKALTLAWIGVLGWVACAKSEDTAPPTIERFRLTLKDSSITAAGIGNTVAIIGTHLASTQQVYFNDFPLALNLSYVKDDAIVVQLPRETPYRGQSNKVKVVTLYGEAIKDFIVNQPPPTITSFSPASGDPGTIVTITGKDLDNVKTVLVGADTVKILAGGTDTQLKIQIPPKGAQGNITVITVGGDGKSVGSFGVSLIIYDDKIASDWDAFENDADRNMASTEQFKKGKSIKMVFQKNRGYFGAGPSADPINLKKYIALKVSLYAQTTDPEVKMKIAIKDANGGTNAFAKILVLKPGWNEFILDLITDLNNPPRLGELQIQEWDNAKIPVIFIDDLGLL
jgi:IPT/TIG domain